MKNELTEIIKDSELEPTKSEVVLKQFTGFFEQAKEWETKSKAIVVTDVFQVKEMQQARDARLALKEIRVNAEKTRKELKEQSLREGKAIDGIANVIKALVVPIEEHLEKQEKFAEVQEEIKRELTNEKRSMLLRPYVLDVTLYNLKDMSEAGFTELLNASQVAFETKKEAERKAEEDRIAKEKADKAEQERIKQENEKLKKDAEAREKEIAEERKKAEVAKKKADEAQRKEREAREKAERELQEKEEADAREKQEEEERVQTERQAKERLEKEENYKQFLATYGYTEKTKEDFKVVKVGDQVHLFKKVGTFNI